MQFKLPLRPERPICLSKEVYCAKLPCYGHSTAVQPPLIIHHSSYTTHHTPLIKPPLIIHHSSYTTHHTPLIKPPLIIHHSSYTTHHTPLIKPPLIKPPLIIHHSSNHHFVKRFVNLHVQISWQVQYKKRFREIADARNAVFFNRTGGFEPGKSSSAERRLRDGLGSWSDHARIVPPLWLEFSLEVQISWQAQHFVNLHVQISWQVPRFVNFEVQISWQAQHFVKLHVQISWHAQRFVNLHVQISWQTQHFVNLHVQISRQVQQFVNLHVQISWQVQYKMRFREMADVRNAVFFDRTGGFEPGKSSSAERRLPDGLGSWSDHAQINPPLWLEFSLVS